MLHPLEFRATEHLCKFKDETVDDLTRTRTYRCINAIDPNEDKHLHENVNWKDFIDIYAFGVSVRVVSMKRVTSLHKVCLIFTEK